METNNKNPKNTGYKSRRKQAKKKRKVQAINGRVVTITNIVFNALFIFSLVLLFVGIINGNKSFKNFVIGLTVLLFFISSILITLLVISLFQKKWHLYAVVLLIGFLTLFVASIAGSFLLLNDLKTKLIPWRIQGYRWTSDNNMFDNVTSKNDIFEEFKSGDVEDVEIITNVLSD